MSNYRKSTKESDKIYGILGLIDPKIKIEINKEKNIKDIIIELFKKASEIGDITWIGLSDFDYNSIIPKINSINKNYIDNIISSQILINNDNVIINSLTKDIQISFEKDIIINYSEELIEFIKKWLKEINIPENVIQCFIHKDTINYFLKNKNWMLFDTLNMFNNIYINYVISIFSGLETLMYIKTICDDK